MYFICFRLIFTQVTWTRLWAYDIWASLACNRLAQNGRVIANVNTSLGSSLGVKCCRPLLTGWESLPVAIVLYMIVVASHAVAIGICQCMAQVPSLGMFLTHVIIILFLSAAKSSCWTPCIFPASGIEFKVYYCCCFNLNWNYFSVLLLPKLPPNTSVFIRQMQ